MILDTFFAYLFLIFPGILFIGQLISSINFELAQKLGLQEDPAQSDPLLQRTERYIAYWDLITLVWMPVAGLLILTNNNIWPIIALLAGSIYIDTAGREASKILSFKHHGLKTGSKKQHLFFFSTYIIMLTIGIVAVIYSIYHLLELN